MIRLRRKTVSRLKTNFQAALYRVCEDLRFCMKQSEQKKNAEKSSGSKTVSAEESLQRMKKFGERKEKIIASVIKSEN